MKTFKNKDFEQIHVHTDSSKKLDALQLTSSSSSANKNNDKVGYQLPTPTPKCLKQIHTNNKHFMSNHWEKFINTFHSNGTVLALEVVKVYKNREHVVIQQKGQAWTQFEYVNETICDLGLPPLIDKKSYHIPHLYLSLNQ